MKLFFLFDISRWLNLLLWSAVLLTFLSALELLDMSAVSTDLSDPHLSDPHHIQKRFIQQIPLGTPGFPIPIDIDPIPSG